MKKIISVLVVGLAMNMVIAPARAAMATSLSTCALCARTLPEQKVFLTCAHPACATCLQPFFEKKAVCLRCQEKKQTTALRVERWSSLTRNILGAGFAGVVIAYWQLDTWMSKRSLTNVKSGYTNPIKPA